MKIEDSAGVIWMDCRRDFDELGTPGAKLPLPQALNKLRQKHKHKHNKIA
jgi:hypothetical protein